MVYDVSNPFFLRRTIIVNDNRKRRWIFLLYGIGSLVATDSALAESKSAASKRSFAALLARTATVAAPRPAKEAAHTAAVAAPRPAKEADRTAAVAAPRPAKEADRTAAVAAPRPAKPAARSATVAAPRLAKAAARNERPAHPTIVKKVVAKAHAVQSTPVTNRVARASSVKPVTSTAVYGVTAATNVIPASGYGSGRDAYVEALYPLILGRAATQSDVDYWARVLYGGTQASSVAESIWNSQEHRSLQRSGEAPNIPLATAYRRAYAWGLLHCQELEAAKNRSNALD